MQPTIQFLLQLVPLLTMFALYTGLVKLSALISRLKLSWPHSLLFAVLLAVVLMAVNAAAMVTQVTVSFAAGVSLAIMVNLVLGGWFLRKRATRLDGQPAGVAGGVRLGAVLVGLSGAIGVAMMGILGYARRSLN